MLIGILSDSHGRHLAVRQAMTLFDELGVEHVIHCGDVGGMKVFDELVGRPCTFVWGNTDTPDGALISYLQTVEISLPNGAPTTRTLDGKTFAVFHGHERQFEPVTVSSQFDYVLHGHSHLMRDDRIDGTRIINPGALYRARRKTVATLDTTADKLTFHEIKGV